MSPLRQYPPLARGWGIRVIVHDETELHATAWRRELYEQFGVSMSATSLSSHAATGLLRRERVAGAPSGRGQTGYFKRREIIPAVYMAGLRAKGVAEQEIGARCRALLDERTTHREDFLIECAVLAIEAETLAENPELVKLEARQASRKSLRRACLLRRALLLDFQDDVLLEWSTKSLDGEGHAPAYAGMQEHEMRGPIGASLQRVRAWTNALPAPAFPDDLKRSYELELDLYEAVKFALRFLFAVPPGWKAIHEPTIGPEEFEAPWALVSYQRRAYELLLETLRAEKAQVV